MPSHALHDISHEIARRTVVHGSGLCLPRLLWFRALVVAALVASVLVTWPLWGLRQRPPLLPAFDLPQAPLGLALIAASLAALVAPRSGAIVVSVLLAYGMATDQTRMQPEFFSLPLLLWGSLPSPGAQLVARAHLVSMWFFAGLHKALSPAFLEDMGPRLIQSLPLPIPNGVVPLAVLGIIALEMGTALLAIVPRTRRIAAWAAFALHAGIFLTLSPLGEARNSAVWPWNIALAFSGFALIAPWKTGVVKTIAVAPPLPRVVAVALALIPATFYAGIADAYPAHHLYSAGTARATVYCPVKCLPDQDLYATWKFLNVPLPPEPRLFEGTFRAICQPGDVLRVIDPYPPPWSEGSGNEPHSCPSGSLTPAHP